MPTPPPSRIILIRISRPRTRIYYALCLQQYCIMRAASPTRRPILRGGGQRRGGGVHLTRIMQTTGLVGKLNLPGVTSETRAYATESDFINACTSFARFTQTRKDPRRAAPRPSTRSRAERARKEEGARNYILQQQQQQQAATARNSEHAEWG